MILTTNETEVIGASDLGNFVECENSDQIVVAMLGHMIDH